MEFIRSEDRLCELREAAQGFIFNDFSHGPAGRENNVLHEASCPWLRSANLGVRKVFFETLSDAVAWLDEHRPENWKRCGTCCGGSRCAPVTDREAARSDESMDPFKESTVQDILVRYLRECGYRVHESQRLPSGIIDVVAESSTEKLAIEVKGEDRGGYTSAQMNFQMGVGQILSRMTDHAVQYAVAFPLTDDFRRVLRTYEGTFGFEQARISAFVIQSEGNVLRLTPAEFQRFIDHGCELDADARAALAGRPSARRAATRVAPPEQTPLHLDRIRQALAAYRQQATNRAWLVSNKARLYVLAEKAFAPDRPDFRAFAEIYQELRSYWQVFRGGDRWPPEKAFETLLSPACRPCAREQLDLITLASREDVQAVWQCLAAMSGVKRLQSGEVSAVAVSKFLHFFNPRLFPIFDRTVVKHRAIPWFRTSLDRSRARWQARVAPVESDPLWSHGLGGYLHYVLWACDCLAAIEVDETMAVFEGSFAEMLELEDRGAEAPASIRQNYATVFEFALIGASLPDRGTL